MSLHPFLRNQENLQAFQQLTARPTGSVRKWEQLLGWRPGRLQRFLASLKKYGLAEVETCRQFSTFRPLVGVADCSGVMRTVAVSNQEHCSGLTASRLRKKPDRQPVPVQPGTELLVQVMNLGLKSDGYAPVSSDNYGSHRAARKWLVDSKMSLEEAIAILRPIVAAFSLAKSGGNYPASLGYFTKAVLAEWARIQRDRQQLKLFPKLDMHVERVPLYVPEPAGHTSPQVSAAVLDELAKKLGVVR